jgi:uncharacterized protein with GYD domain
MPKYITLINWTEKGVAEAKTSPDRIDMARALARQMGGDIEQVFMTMGSYDLVVILDMPDDEAAAQLALSSAAGGHIRTTTLKAFDEASYRKILGSL